MIIMNDNDNNSTIVYGRGRRSGGRLEAAADRSLRTFRYNNDNDDNNDNNI